MKRSPLVVIFVTVLIDLIGFGIVIPVLPRYAELFHGSVREIGLLVVCYSLMQFIFSPILGGLSDTYGRRPVLLFSIIGAGFSYIIVGLAQSLAMLFIGRTLAGIMGANLSTAQAYIADVTAPEERAKGMGLIGAAFGLGFVAGPMLGGLLYTVNEHLPFFFTAGLSFANAGLLYFVLPETVTPDHPARARAGGNRLSALFGAFNQARLALVTLLYFLLVTAFSMMTTAFVPFTQYRFGYGPRENGGVFFLIGLTAAIFQGLLIGRLVKRFGEIKLAIAGTLILLAGFLAVPFLSPLHTGALAALLFCAASFAIGNGLTSTTLASLASKSVGPEEQGRVLGMTQGFASLARVAGPGLVSVLSFSAAAANSLHLDDHSVLRTFWAAAGITLLAALLAFYFASRYATEPATSTGAATAGA
jgi:multidrug resistance protein